MANNSNLHSGKVRFVRIRGRVVPIRSKGAESMGVRRDKGRILGRLARYDEDMATMERQAGAAFGLGAVGAAATGIKRVAGKTIFKPSTPAIIGAGVLGGLSLLNYSFAEGRHGSARLMREGAASIHKGIPFTPSIVAIGAAQNRAMRNIRDVKKMGRKDLRYFQKTMGIKKTSA